jgi:Protein of unknown function (DUF3226)
VSVRYAYLVVEGPQDVEVVARLLKPHGFSRIRKFDELDAYWHQLVPRTFPHKGELNRPVPVPVFFTSAAVSVAVQSAGSDSQIVPRVEETLSVRFPAPLDALGAILDADSKKAPQERFKAVQNSLAKLGLTFPEQPGQVSTTSPRCGIFVLPDNQTAGTLEDLLLECANVHYAGLVQEARTFVARIRPDDPAFTREDMEELRKPAGLQKATVASVVSVLKPGRNLQVSLQDNRWLEGAALNLARIARVQQFLQELLSLS